ncbi:hypothetical protein ACH419_30450 [Streptomyces bobili]|uniref:hypothetical protein n=1 Tax=Streptomyces bobili TaxID=67280 RepID=UPI0037B1CD83
MLYVCAGRGPNRPPLAAERAEEEGRAFAADHGFTVIETVRDPYGVPDPVARAGWRRVKELAEAGGIGAVIARWPVTISPDQAPDLRHREVNELLKQGVHVLYSWSPLTARGVVR